jgi:CBS domain-containing protein
MTRNPIAVYDHGPRNDALSTMISRKFRHLPVISSTDDDENEDAETSNSPMPNGGATNVVGLLDITKCVFERLDDLEKKVNEDANIVAAMEALERRGQIALEHVGVMKSQHGCPQLHSVLATEGGTDVLPEVSPKSSVREAAKVMKELHQTAILVLSEGSDEKLAGIFTTKDIVLRVIAANLDPERTSVIRVMVCIFSIGFVLINIF